MPSSPSLLHRARYIPLVIMMGISPVWADESDPMWQLCKPLDVIPVPSSTGPDDKAPIEVSSNKATSQPGQGMLLEGDVRIRQGSRLMQADRVDYSEHSGDFKADGNVLFRNPNYQVESLRARVKLTGNEGVYEDVNYKFTPRHASGEASRMESKGEITQFEAVSFTTCDPAQVDWQMKADAIKLDQAAKQGTARDIVLYFKDVPIFYFPYLRFPVSEDRLSGFLFPGIGYHNESGWDISVPYYWNMAPNYDMTITPHLVSERGILLEDKFRYLTENSRGVLDFEYLPGDRLTGTDRGMAHYEHNGRLGSHWSTRAEVNYVSESSFYSDFGKSSELSRAPYLKNLLQSTYTGTQWGFTGSLEAYQTLSGIEPYQRMPQLVMNYRPAGNNRLNTLFNSEYNYFYSADKNIIGSRLHTVAGLSYPYRHIAGFLVPRLTWHSTHYEVEDRSLPASNQYSRDLPVFSLDSGLFFERNLADGRLMQTLEPRLYYLNVPYQDQDALPRFDSSAYTFDFNQLFRENRFTGSDVIGDANQLTVAVTTRFLSTASGNELFSASLGQILYFEDRRVTLNPSSSDLTESGSDYVAELSAQPFDHWDWRATLLWDPVTDSADIFNTRLQYKPNAAHIVNLAYRSTANAGTPSLSQADTSALWKLNSRWHLYGRYNHDLLNQESLETLYGFGYESCCWSLRLTQRDYRPSTGAELQSGLMLEFEFKGLGSAGAGVDDYLKSGILGYESKPR
ncbi:MAG: LPS assembly protein LptD [Gammaproteobacteria bacterium]|nr:LPS assembly protein LptD [Gammaproteobacteria bacterium]